MNEMGVHVVYCDDVQIKGERWCRVCKFCKVLLIIVIQSKWFDVGAVDEICNRSVIVIVSPLATKSADFNCRNIMDNKKIVGSRCLYILGVRRFRWFWQGTGVVGGVGMVLE